MDAANQQWEEAASNATENICQGCGKKAEPYVAESRDSIFSVQLPATVQLPDTVNIQVPQCFVQVWCCYRCMQVWPATNIRLWAKKFEELYAGENYEMLKVAVQDLLTELRIDSKCLAVMAEGYSPDYPGSATWKDECLGTWKNPHCKVQLSQAVARKLIAAGVAGTSVSECDQVLVTNTSGHCMTIPGAGVEIANGVTKEEHVQTK